MKRSMYVKLLCILLVCAACMSGCSSKQPETDKAADKLKEMSEEFGKKYSKDTEYEEYISDGFSEKYTDSMTEDMIRFESYIFSGSSGAQFKGIEANENGEYILTYIYAINNNEYVPSEGGTLPAGGTAAEPEWRIGVLTYNASQGSSEYAYYTGMYYEYFYTGEYTCRYLYDEQDNRFFLFGYKQQ